MSQKIDTAKTAILDAALKLAPFDGWNTSMLARAAEKAGLPKGAEALYFPDGVLELIGYWSAQMDASAQSKITALDLANMKIRNRVTAGVLARLEAIDGHDEAARRAGSRLALPDAIAQGTALIWASADMIWCAIGDTSTDVNFYSKRATLSAVIGSTLPVWLSTDEDDHAKGRAFLDARIANVMQFEKFKWDMKTRTKDWPNPAEVLGGLRYGKSPFKRRRRRHSRTL